MTSNNFSRIIQCAKTTDNFLKFVAHVYDDYKMVSPSHQNIQFFIRSYLLGFLILLPHLNILCTSPAAKQHYTKMTIHQSCHTAVYLHENIPGFIELENLPPSSSDSIRFTSQSGELCSNKSIAKSQETLNI